MHSFYNYSPGSHCVPVTFPSSIPRPSRDSPRTFGHQEHPFSLPWSDTFEFTAHLCPFLLPLNPIFSFSPSSCSFPLQDLWLPISLWKKVQRLCLFLCLFNIYRSLTLGVGCSWLIEGYLYLAAANVAESIGNSGGRRSSDSSPRAITHCHDRGQVT